MAEDKACSKCGKSFATNQALQRHLNRKTPCALIVDDRDLSEEKKDNPNKCKFCGRTFVTSTSMRRHIRTTCKIAPREGNTEGMEKLYLHVLQRQKRLEEENAAMKEEMRELRDSQTSSASSAALAVPGASTQIAAHITNNITTLVDKSVNNTVNVNISIFGQERLDRITKPQVFDILRGLGPVGENVKTIAEKAIIQAAMLIFSDPAHPEDITCYLPNKKGEDALVHGEGGWEVQPVGLVISPMAAQSIETLFRLQPAPDQDTPEKDVKWIMDECGNIMRYIQKHEGDLTNEPPRGEMRGVLIRNKELLQQVLKKLPMAGQK